MNRPPESTVLRQTAITCALTPSDRRIRIVRSFKYALPRCDHSIRGLNQEGIMFNARPDFGLKASKPTATAMSH